MLKSLLLAAICLASAAASLSEEPECAQISLRAQMSTSRSSTALAGLRVKAASTYRNDLVFAARELELSPASKTAANRLLDLLPPDGDPNHAAWLDLTDLQECVSGGFSNHELDALIRLEYRLPRLLAKAVVLSPEKMPIYVGHTQLFITPESDFTIHMQAVCRRYPKEFMDAVNNLSPKDRQWFITTIFNPKTCRTIFYPEQ